MNPMYNQANIFEDINATCQTNGLPKKILWFAWFALNHPLNNWVYINNPLTSTF